MDIHGYSRITIDNPLETQFWLSPEDPRVKGHPGSTGEILWVTQPGNHSALRALCSDLWIWKVHIYIHSHSMSQFNHIHQNQIWIDLVFCGQNPVALSRHFSRNFPGIYLEWDKPCRPLPCPIVGSIHRWQRKHRPMHLRRWRFTRDLPRRIKNRGLTGFHWSFNSLPWKITMYHVIKV
jgi:hypothetical protein